MTRTGTGRCGCPRVKARQVPEAARAIRPLLAPAPKVLPLQNGVEAPRPATAGSRSRAYSGWSLPDHQFRYVARQRGKPISASSVLDAIGLERPGFRARKNNPPMPATFPSPFLLLDFGHD
jgi:hypothetical protein